MSKISDKLAFTLQIRRSALVKALQEMYAFEQALNSSTAFYVYPLGNKDQWDAERLGLILTKKTNKKMVRLTSYGREVVNSLDLVTEES